MRWYAKRNALRERRKQSDASWAHKQSVLTTLGAISVGWAGVELMLTQLVIWHHVSNKVTPDKDLARMLALQLDYIENNMENDASIDEETRKRISEIRHRATELNMFRVNVIHGIVHQNSRRTTDWLTYSIRIEGLSWREVRTAYTNEEIASKFQQIQKLGSDMAPFIARITRIPPNATSV